LRTQKRSIVGAVMVISRNKYFIEADFICPRRTETSSTYNIHLKNNNNNNKQIKKPHLLHLRATQGVLYLSYNLTWTIAISMMKGAKIWKRMVLSGRTENYDFGLVASRSFLGIMRFFR